MTTLQPPPINAGIAPYPWTSAERERLAELGLVANPHEPDLRFDAHQCEVLSQHGLFVGERIQLINGEVYTMAPPNEPHTNGLTLVQVALWSVFGKGYYVRNQGALELAADTIVVPDFTVILGGPRDNAPRPTSALLVVEVSDTTFTHDVTVKAELYATANIADYWVLDLVSRRLLVFRDPAPLPDGGNAYRTQLIRYPHDTITPLAAPHATITIADLLP